MGFGCVMRNDHGQWLFGVVRHNSGGSPFLTEALTLLHGFRQAWNRGYTAIVYESDCMELVDVLTEAGSERFIGTIRDIKSMILHDWDTSIVWSPRESNRAADWLAASGLMLPNLIPVEVPDSDLETILLRDSLFAP
ncbi:hypothetical protein OROGR_011493 [Orobanche gracilis]